MKCEDCIHSGVCKAECQPAPLSDTFTYECECIEKYCGDFKARSRFVELPCKAGDIVYLITDEDVSPVHIDRVRIDEYSVMFDWYNFYTNEVGSFNLIEIGRYIYLSGNEAEQALKERGKNG